MLFNIYMTPNTVKTHNLSIISYTDNTQLILYLSDYPSTTRAKFHDWMKDNCLKLNTDKTKVLIFGNSCNSPWTDAWWPSELGPTPTPTNHARNLGIILYCKLSMEKQINSVSSAFFLTLHMLSKVPLNTRRTVTQALITSRLD